MGDGVGDKDFAIAIREVLSTPRFPREIFSELEKQGFKRADISRQYQEFVGVGKIRVLRPDEPVRLKR